MSRDNVKSEETVQQDILWSQLINDAEMRISRYKKEIERLKKSIGFFKKQESDGVPFPMRKTG